MDTFRALVAKGGKSPRAVEVTEQLIRMNPGHYSIWWVLTQLSHRRISCTDSLLPFPRSPFSPDSSTTRFCRAYRAETLLATKADLSKELDLMDELVKEHIKSYQVWCVARARGFVSTFSALG